MTDVHLRDERAQDFSGIDRIHRLAFADHPHSLHNEERIVRALRATGRLTLSIVAVRDGEPVGHVAFSPVTLSDGSAGWYGLGPVAVLPERQGEGIGGRLVRAGLARLRGLGGAGCVLVGEPAYYGRFGFAASDRLTLPGLPAGYFQVLSFGGEPPPAEVAYDPAFDTR